MSTGNKSVASPPEEVAEQQPRRSLLAIKLGIAVASVLFTLLLAEGALRLAGVKPAPIPYGDATLGHVPLAATARLNQFPGEDRYYVVRTNNLDLFEDHDTSIVKPAGTRRIAVVGDSHTACACPNDLAYPHLLQANLNRQGNRYEVLNAGVGTYSPYQYYIRAKKYLLPLKPDHIIVAFYVGNDYLDLIRRDDRPYLTLNPDGSFTEHPPVFLTLVDPSRPAGWLDNSRVYSITRVGLGPTLLYEADRFRMLLEDLRSTGHGVFSTLHYMFTTWRLSRVSIPYMTQIIHQQLWFERFPSTFQTAHALNRQVMRMFAELCRQNHMRLTYVILPTKIDIEPEEIQGVIAGAARIDKNLTEENVRKFNDVITQQVLRDGRELNVEVFDLKPYLLAQKRSAQVYKFGMHPTTYGNQIIANALTELMLSQPPARAVSQTR